MSTERFVSLPLITVNYIYNDLLLIVECVEWSCGVVDVEVVCLSGVIVIDSTSFQVYGLISQEPYIYKSVTTETKSIKSLTSVTNFGIICMWVSPNKLRASRVISLLRDMLCGI
jgi:hypothetical protein